VTRGLLIVESAPSSPDRVEEYHRWYDEVHIPQLLSFDLFVSARRFEPVGGVGAGVGAAEGPFVAVYELEADDIAAAFAKYRAASARGELDRSDALQTDPPPRVRLLIER